MADDPGPRPIKAEEIELYTEWNDAQANVGAASRQLTDAKRLYDSAVARVLRAQKAIDEWATRKE